MNNFITKVAEEEGIDLKEEIRKRNDRLTLRKVFKLEIEKINDMLYLYERETHDFICQANSIEELAVKAKEYKNIIVATVITHDNRVFMFSNGVPKEYTGPNESQHP
jgi:hypothetical protein